ncbi:MAG: helix-turn-helix domain-containing protein [Phycisphaerae bacterium]|nr:helix-turn-helix domain-containing protein [Phycisphaerae bacterium]
MNKRKDVLTTGQVAQICNVAPRTVTKWFDSGQLKGYRIPGSRDRRIPTGELIRFMKAHSIPTDALEMGRTRVMIIDSNSAAASGLAAQLKDRKDYEIQVAENSFDAGLVAQKLLPHVILINLMAKDIDAAHICQYVRASDDLNAAKIIAVANRLGETEITALLKKGFDGAVPNAGDIQEVIRTIEEATAIIY